MNPIGFAKEGVSSRTESRAVERRAAEPVPSVVQVYFPSRSRELSYYNDRFDLREGDTVFVDGKLAGERGQVTDVRTSFKIKAADYKKVIAQADVRVEGEFRPLGAHMVTFDRGALPFEQVRTWLLPPEEEGEYYVHYSDKRMPLGDFGALHISNDVRERGQFYFLTDHVRYLSLDGVEGRAVVEGTRGYAVEFRYEDGQISRLNCSCPCGYHCKHEVAVMLQLKRTLGQIERSYDAAWRRSRYFALVHAPLLLSMAVSGNPDAVLHLTQT